MCTSQTPDEYILPKWAQRVAKSKIRLLYELDAKGIYDEDLLNEVGYALYARCQSFIEACRATSGEVICPVCRKIILHNLDKESLLICPGCDWQLTWEKYFATIQHKQLSGAEPVLELFREYIIKFPKANSDQEKMFYIDKLLHGFHWSVRYGPTRPVAINLIKGRLNDVIQFLDALSYGPAKHTWNNPESNRMVREKPECQGLGGKVRGGMDVEFSSSSRKRNVI